MNNTEFTNKQLERTDEVENAVFELCKLMTEQDLEWDISYIGEIADIAADVLVRHDFKVRYPAIVIEPNGYEHIEDYHG